MVQNNQVVLIDENRKSYAGKKIIDGLHQAIEQKENVPIQMESQTHILYFQNYFRQYEKLSE